MGMPTLSAVAGGKLNVKRAEEVYFALGCCKMLQTEAFSGKLSAADLESVTAVMSFMSALAQSNGSFLCIE